jgi:hypothetical protein
MLRRYDTMALKSLDIFSLHGFPVGLVHAESNLLRIINDGGTGGWANIIDKYAKATRHGITYRKIKRAERVEGFEQAPDFVIPNEFDPL